MGHEVRRLFDDLRKRRPDRRHMVSGECMPLLDVFETDRTIEVVLDVPGVTPEGVRILIKSGVVLIVGEKERPEPALRARQASTSSSATSAALRAPFASMPRLTRRRSAPVSRTANCASSCAKIQERRGREILVPVETEPTPRRRRHEPAVHRRHRRAPRTRSGAPRVEALVAAHAIDVVIANIENAAGGAGVTREITDEVLGSACTR